MEVLDMGWKGRIGKFFHTKDGEIQRAYQSYDRASDLLGARDRNPDTFTKSRELEEAVKEAENLAAELLEKYEGVKSWPGIFREMHMNLVRLWLKTERYEDALKECDKVAEYNPLDAEELREAIQEAMSGKKLEASQLDEVGVA
jgi:regulator of sirC expression with transglutaminase-like and TPR domain